MTNEQGWVEWRGMEGIRSTYFLLNNTFFIVTTKSSVTDVFKVLWPIFGALSDLVPFVQFKKRKKHPWRSVNFSKVAG